VAGTKPLEVGQEEREGERETHHFLQYLQSKLNPQKIEEREEKKRFIGKKKSK